LFSPQERLRPAPKGEPGASRHLNANAPRGGHRRGVLGLQPVKSIIPNPRFGGGIPDAQFIREQVPIAEVASALGLEVFATGMIRCWHPEHHHHGDRTPSVGIDRHYNKVKCFGCGGKLLGPIDLVVDVRECNLPEAIRWIAQRFEVPSIPKGKQLVKPKGHVARYGYERPIELLLRSGLWAKMSHPAQMLAVTFVELKVEGQRDRSWELEISYRGLAQYSGLKSDASVSKGLKELQRIGWLQRQRRRTGRSRGPVRETATYTVTPYSDAVRELANATAADLRAAIEEERQMRAEKRAQRTRAWRQAKRGRDA